MQYSAIVLGATGNVGGRIVQLFIKNPLCKRVVLVTRRKTNAFPQAIGTAPKVSEVVVNLDRLEEEVAPHAQGIDIALAAFGIGKGSGNMPDEEVHKIEVGYPQAFCRAAKTAGARVCSVMTAIGADPNSRFKFGPFPPNTTRSTRMTLHARWLPSPSKRSWRSSRVALRSSQP